MSTERFAADNFRHINIVMSRKSLKAAMDMAEHPVFGPYISSITMSARRLASSDLETASRSIKKGILHNLYHDAEDPTLDGAGYTFCNKFHEQEHCESTGQGLVYLHRVLKSIKTHGQAISLTMTDFDEPPTPIGDHKYWSELDPRYRTHGSTNRRETIRTLFQAADSSGCKVKSLQIIMSDNADSNNASPMLSGHASFSVKDIEPNGLPVIGRVCKNLNSISIDLGGASYLFTNKTITALAKLLHHSTAATSIGLILGSKYEGYDNWEAAEERPIHPGHAFHNMTSAISSPALSDLMLHHCNVVEDDLIRLLERHQHSIKLLDMRFCALLGGGRWSRVLSWIGDHMSVESISLSELLLLDEPDDMSFTWCSVNMRDFEVKGVTEIKEGLRKKLPRLEQKEIERESEWNDFGEWDSGEE